MFKTLWMLLLVSLLFNSGSFGLAQAGLRGLSDSSPDTGLAIYLHAIDEPSLLNSSKERIADAYRLIWRGFPSGRRVVVRLSVDTDGAATVVAKVTEGGAEARLVFEKTDRVTAKDLEKFREVVTRNNFWALPSTEVQEPPFPKDGTSWMLEGVHEGVYHAVSRRNPKPGRYTEVGRYLAKDIAKLGDSTLTIPEYTY